MNSIFRPVNNLGTKSILLNKLEDVFNTFVKFNLNFNFPIFLIVKENFFGAPKSGWWKYQVPLSKKKREREKEIKGKKKGNNSLKFIGGRKISK